MISSVLTKLAAGKRWDIDDSPQYFPQICENPEAFVTWKDVEKCLNNPQFYDIQFISKHGDGYMTVPAWRRPWGKDFTPDVKDIVETFQNGNSIIINNFEYMDGKQDLLSQIEAYFPDIRAAFHVYCGVEGSKSFEIHEDFAHNFILQVDGETNWKVYNNRCSYLCHDHPPNKYSHEDLDCVIDVVMQPGDMLYIPARCYHQAQPLGKRLSISIPMVHPEFAGPEMKFMERKYYGIC